MKSFIYGIDGGDRRIFSYFDMPFYRDLEGSHSYVDLKEDLLNRGWSEIITGALGRDTGGFYMSPELDGSARLSMKYKMGSVPKDTNIELIWDMLPEGTRVGVMNVPSLLPVVPVNGFCVGSAGAGISKVDEITDELVFPSNAKSFLNAQGYIADIRLNASDIEDVDDWFSRLKKMEERRVRCYIDLAEQFSIDFGILIDRGTTVIQYIFMSEIAAMMDRDAGKSPVFLPTPKIEAHLRDYYSFVDHNIRILVEALRPSQFILASDHGHEPMTHHCNPNVLLESTGYLHFNPKAGPSYSKKVKSVLSELLPRNYKRKLKTGLRTMGLSARSGPKIYELLDTNKTLAFSHFHMPGVYLNDERFGGPVAEGTKAALTEEICHIFNIHASSLEHGIRALPCRIKYKSAKYSDKLPDIRLTLPDYMFPACKGKNYIEMNPLYGPVPNFDKVGSEMHTGTKGSVPLCLVDAKTRGLVKEDDHHDLTLIYNLVNRYFNQT